MNSPQEPLVRGQGAAELEPPKGVSSYLYDRNTEKFDSVVARASQFDFEKFGAALCDGVSAYETAYAEQVEPGAYASREPETESPEARKEQAIALLASTITSALVEVGDHPDFLDIVDDWMTSFSCTTIWTKYPGRFGGFMGTILEPIKKVRPAAFSKASPEIVRTLERAAINRRLSASVNLAE